MIVSELIAILKSMPQDMGVILDDGNEPNVFIDKAYVGASTVDEIIDASDDTADSSRWREYVFISPVAPAMENKPLSQ